MIGEYKFNLDNSPKYLSWEFYSLQTEQWNKISQASYVKILHFIFKGIKFKKVKLVEKWGNDINRKEGK